MSWATPEDVRASWIGEGAPVDDEQTQIWLDKAHREIIFRVPTVTDRISVESQKTPPVTDTIDLAKDVEIAMVTRVFRNPEGIRQTNVTTGPYTASKTYGGDVPGGLGLTDDELKKLQGNRGGAFTIDMIPPWSQFAGWPE